MPDHVLKRLNLSDNIIQEVRRMIAAGEYKEGQRLPAEKDLALQLGVGRTSLREALKALSLMGLIRVENGRGMFVENGSARFLTQSMANFIHANELKHTILFEAREVVEPAIAAAAAERATAADAEDIAAAIAELDSQLDRAGETGCFQSLVDDDFAVHRAIARATHNPFLVALDRSLCDLCRDAVAAVTSTADGVRSSVNALPPLLRAIRAGDSAAARRAMAEHVAYGREVHYQVWVRGGPDGQGVKSTTADS
ncbi:MAG: FadR/GntR family transcriptional regulator [Chloroflexota bacterium]